MKHGASALALLLVVWPLPGPGAGRSERLAEIRQEIEAREARAQSYRAEAKGYFEELDALDRLLTETRRSRRRLRRRQRAAEEELKLEREGLGEAAGTLEKTRKALEIRLVALYKFGSTGGVPALLSARDFQTFARRREGLARVLAQDAELFDRYQTIWAAWDRQRDQTERLLAEIATAQTEIDKRDQRVRHDSIERHNLIALLRSRSAQEERAAQELRRAAERLQRAIEEMPAGFVPPSGTGLRQGRVPWPVRGPVRLDFGRQTDPEFGTLTRRSGIEIESDRGTPVTAVSAGRVLYAGWFQGYGQLVILDHGGDTLSVSGYLEELSVDKGRTVQLGETIGTVGETGSLLGPGLYFEIRHQGKPVDPQAWLGSR